MRAESDTGINILTQFRTSLESTWDPRESLRASICRQSPHSPVAEPRVHPPSGQGALCNLIGEPSKGQVRNATLGVVGSTSRFK